MNRKMSKIKSKVKDLNYYRIKRVNLEYKLMIQLLNVKAVCLNSRFKNKSRSQMIKIKKNLYQNYLYSRKWILNKVWIWNNLRKKLKDLRRVSLINLRNKIKEILLKENNKMVDLTLQSEINLNKNLNKVQKQKINLTKSSNYLLNSKKSTKVIALK